MCSANTVQKRFAFISRSESCSEIIAVHVYALVWWNVTLNISIVVAAGFNTAKNALGTRSIFWRIYEFENCRFAGVCEWVNEFFMFNLSDEWHSIRLIIFSPFSAVSPFSLNSHPTEPGTARPSKIFYLRSFTDTENQQLMNACIIWYADGQGIEKSFWRLVHMLHRLLMLFLWLCAAGFWRSGERNKKKLMHIWCFMMIAKNINSWCRFAASRKLLILILVHVCKIKMHFNESQVKWTNHMSHFSKKKLVQCQV